MYVRKCLPGQTVTDTHAGRKIIDKLNTFALIDVLHSACCITKGTGKWRSIYFRQDLHKLVFFRIFLISQVSLSNFYNFPIL